MASEAPEYLICIECETPCYTFEETPGGREALCEMCGNEDPDMFTSQEDFDALARDDDADH